MQCAKYPAFSINLARSYLKTYHHNCNKLIIDIQVVAEIINSIHLAISYLITYHQSTINSEMIYMYNSRRNN